VAYDFEVKAGGRVDGDAAWSRCGKELDEVGHGQ